MVINIPVISFGADVETEITHRPIDDTYSGIRIEMEATVTDPSEIAEVRIYFKSSEEDNYFFVKMINTKDDKYIGVLPSPSKETKQVEYLILVRNNADPSLIVKTQNYTIDIKESNKSTLTSGEIQVYTELQNPPEMIVGFNDNIVIDTVESGAKLGAALGLYAVANGVGDGTAAGGTIAASAGGLSTTAIVVSSVAVLAAVGAAAGSGGGGDDNSATSSASGESVDRNTLLGNWAFVGNYWGGVVDSGILSLLDSGTYSLTSSATNGTFSGQWSLSGNVLTISTSAGSCPTASCPADSMFIYHGTVSNNTSRITMKDTTGFNTIDFTR